MKEVIIDGNSLTIEEFVSVARFKNKVQLSNEAIVAMDKARQVVEDMVANDVVCFGVTTGIGKFSESTITRKETAKLQENMIVSHAVGVGQPLDIEVVRGMMLLRINSIAKGYSGVRSEVVQMLVTMLNHDIVPIVPSKGSLAPLAHLVMPLLGHGNVYVKGKKYSANLGLKKGGLEPITLLSKEGLGLINGTQAATSIATLAVYDARNSLLLADMISATTFEALQGISDAFDLKIHELRHQRGQMQTAINMNALVANSSATTKQGEKRLQDAFSLRCIPQIHGPSKDIILYIEKIIIDELNSVTDNPLIFAEDDMVLSGGNFHGQAIALPMDYLAIALSELASASERRIERLMNPALSNGLPAFLVKKGGINSGFMIVQYTAASLVSDNRILANPASVGSITVSAGEQDHISLAMSAAIKAREILQNTQHILGMEILCALQAIDLRKAKKDGSHDKLGAGAKVIYPLIRKNIKMMKNDRQINVDLAYINKLIVNHTIVKEVLKKVKVEI